MSSAGKELPYLDLMPLRLDRAKSPHALGPDEARILQRVDVAWLRGRLRRGPGQVDTQIPSSATNILSAFVGIRRDCRKFVLDSSAGGVVRLVPADQLSLVCLGPVNEWGTAEADVEDEDTGIDEAGGSVGA